MESKSKVKYKCLFKKNPEVKNLALIYDGNRSAEERGRNDNVFSLSIEIGLFRDFVCKL